MKRKYSWLVPGLLVVASCKVTKPYQQPSADKPGLYRDHAVSDTGSIARIPWNSYFTDKNLQNLINEGLEKNLNLLSALERIKIAKTELQSSKAAFLPEVSGYADTKETRLAYTQGFGIIKNSPQYDVGINASWELDIWGKLSSAKRAAYAGLLRDEAVKKAVQSQLVADIAADYYLLMALDEQLLVLKKTAAYRKSDVETIKALQQSNVVNGAAVVQSEANQYAAEIAVPILKKQIRQTENALSVLIGRVPAPITRNQLGDQQLPMSLNTGFPAQILANRPDVEEAELAFRVSFENNNIARTYFYPSLTLTAAGGFSSFSLGDWFTRNTGLFGNIAAGVFQPIYNKGINKARLKTAQAQQQVAFNNFQQTLLTAGQEVSDALYAWQTVEERKDNRHLQVQALEKSVDFTKTLLKYTTTTNYTDVLTSEQNLLAAQLDNVTDQLEQWMAVISLYHALGGGWQ